MTAVCYCRCARRVPSVPVNGRRRHSAEKRGRWLHPRPRPLPLSLPAPPIIYCGLPGRPSRFISISNQKLKQKRKLVSKRELKTQLWRFGIFSHTPTGFLGPFPQQCKQNFNRPPRSLPSQLKAPFGPIGSAVSPDDPLAFHFQLVTKNENKNENLFQNGSWKPNFDGLGIFPHTKRIILEIQLPPDTI